MFERRHRCPGRAGGKPLTIREEEEGSVCLAFDVPAAHAHLGFFLTPPSEKCHMTCQIGSEEPPSSNGSIDQTRKTGRNREVLLDVSPQIPFPCRAHWSKKLSAVMYLKVVFFAVVVAAVGAAAAPDSGKFATSRLLS